MCLLPPLNFPALTYFRFVWPLLSGGQESCEAGTCLGHITRMYLSVPLEH